MNVKRFVGKFEQLKGYAPEQQEALLERARYEAFVTLNLVGKATIYLLGCLLLGFIVAISPLLLGYHGLVFIVSLTAGILLGQFIYRRLYAKLLQKGLIQVLDNH